jgi:predicted nucleotide-binding protein (sugar kinase/HSP70/actin superfamily)
MPTGSGPCRFGQYFSFLEDLVKKQKLKDTALFSISSEDAYAGLGSDFERRLWRGIVTSDAMEDIRSMLLANAVNPKAAMQLFKKHWERMLLAFEEGPFTYLNEALLETVSAFKQIPMKKRPEEVPIIALVGEIFVRRDGLSRQYITELLAKEGFAVICSPIGEWVLYTDYLINNGLSAVQPGLKEKVRLFFKQKYMAYSERKIKSILSQTGLIPSSPTDVGSIIDAASHLISPNLTGEAVLTVGSAIKEISSHACGVIGIGPFGCMPNRLSEAILTDNMNVESVSKAMGASSFSNHLLFRNGPLPFLVLESDGSPFTQLLRAKIDAFCLSARRLHARKSTNLHEKCAPN